MQILEKILEEIESREFTNMTIRHSTVVKMKDIRSIFHKYTDKATYKRSDDLIDRKTLKEEVESFRITITGMRNGKTITAWALGEYKKSILRIIDEQPCYGEDINIPTDDGWIPVEERLPEDCEEIVLVQVSGKPADNILFDNAFELALYEKEEGWMLDNYPEWKNPDVIAWCSLPELYRPKIVEKKHKNTQQEMEDFWNNK